MKSKALVSLFLYANPDQYPECNCLAIISSVNIVFPILCNSRIRKLSCQMHAEAVVTSIFAIMVVPARKTDILCGMQAGKCKQTQFNFPGTVVIDMHAKSPRR